MAKIGEKLWKISSRYPFLKGFAGIMSRFNRSALFLFGVNQFHLLHQVAGAGKFVHHKENIPDVYHDIPAN
jgi:hypothetical protein